MNNDVSLSWESYEGYEGWMHPGTARLPRVEASEPALRKLLAVGTSTEGGCSDSFNGYDRGIWSISYLQLLGTIHKAGELMAHIQGAHPEVAAPFLRWLADHDLELDSTGRLYRGSRPVGAQEMGQVLYGCSAKIGSWTEASKAQARSFAETVVRVLRDPAAQTVSQDYTSRELLSWVDASVRATLFPAGKPLEEKGWWGALQAIYVSFTANNPSIAANQFRKLVRGPSDFKPTDPNFVLAMARQLTFGPYIVIYPQRYNALRPVVERLYGVDLPDTAQLLDDWVRVGNPGMDHPLTVQEIQQRLIQLGYTLGPAGADGKYGEKTKEAVRKFQRTQPGLVADGLAGAKTVEALVKATGGLPSPASEGDACTRLSPSSRIPLPPTRARDSPPCWSATPGWCTPSFCATGS